jgi:hypothetical protein
LCIYKFDQKCKLQKVFPSCISTDPIHCHKSIKSIFILQKFVLVFKMLSLAGFSLYCCEVGLFPLCEACLMHLGLYSKSHLYGISCPYIDMFIVFIFDILPLFRIKLRTLWSLSLYANLLSFLTLVRNICFFSFTSLNLTL